MLTPSVHRLVPGGVAGSSQPASSGPSAAGNGIAQAAPRALVGAVDAPQGRHHVRWVGIRFLVGVVEQGGVARRSRLPEAADAGSTPISQRALSDFRREGWSGPWATWSLARLPAGRLRDVVEVRGTPAARAASARRSWRVTPIEEFTPARRDLARHGR